jgi:F plasmid transfer operon protein TraF
MKNRAFLTFVSFVSLVTSPSVVDAQMWESVGIRAQGMGGAFVAVANDATATWWNPAGVATGPYFDSLVEYDHPRVPADTSIKAVAIGFPALGLSYYRLPISQMRAPAPIGASSTGRDDLGYLSQFGATVGQSLGSHLAVSSTLKLVRASETHGDLDLGAMVTMGRLRVGVAMRNVTEPTFGDTADALALKRQTRVGAAFMTGKHGAVNEFTVAVDGDLTSVATAAGDAKHVAAGVEMWTLGHSLGLRGGVSGDTIGDRRSASGGLSLLLQSSRYTHTYVEGQLTGGADEARRGWGIGLRLTF